MYCKYCGKELSDGAVMCDRCGKLTEGANEIMSDAKKMNAQTSGAGAKRSKSWTISMVCFIIYCASMLLSSIISRPLAIIVIRGLLMVPVLVTGVVGMVQSVKDYKEIEKRTFMIVMLALSVIYFVQSLASIITFGMGRYMM